jgi:hypothetical protein
VQYEKGSELAAPYISETIARGTNSYKFITLVIPQLWRNNF